MAARVARLPTFHEVLTEAMNDFVEHGFDSPQRLSDWTERLREAALRTMAPEAVIDRQMKDAFRAIYHRLVENGAILKHHVSAQPYVLARVAHKMRSELDRRLMASASLVRLNRGEVLETTLRRFSGWASSIPVGGVPRSKIMDRVSIRKDLARLATRERNVLTDQSRKFVSNLNAILAREGGAIAAIWHSRFREPGYDYREDHREIDGLVFAVRRCWAMTDGLMRAGEPGCTDQIEAPGELPFCGCFYTHLYALKDLPPGMVTAKGRAALTGG